MFASLLFVLYEALFSEEHRYLVKFPQWSSPLMHFFPMKGKVFFLIIVKSPGCICSLKHSNLLTGCVDGFPILHAVLFRSQSSLLLPQTIRELLSSTLNTSEQIIKPTGRPCSLYPSSESERPVRLCWTKMYTPYPQYSCTVIRLVNFCSFSCLQVISKSYAFIIQPAQSYFRLAGMFKS